jgi:metal-dependent amidase/aminoacylase/carboxypeptidase family protein
VVHVVKASSTSQVKDTNAKSFTTRKYFVPDASGVNRQVRASAFHSIACMSADRLLQLARKNAAASGTTVRVELRGGTSRSKKDEEITEWIMSHISLLMKLDCKSVLSLNVC